MSLHLDITHQRPGFALRARFDAPGGVTALFGRSGAGKTTLIDAVAGLIRPDHGRIEIGGVTLFDSQRGIDLPVHRRRIGYVFQDARLFPHLDLRRNLIYGQPRPDAAALARIVDLLGLGGLLSRRPAGLSGGERARVAIGRALLSEPRLLLLDEPLAALDAPRKAEILPYLEDLRDRAGMPILYVSHDLAEVARMASHVVLLDQGQTPRAGPVEEMLSDPALAPTLGLDRAGAVLFATVEARAEDGLSALAVGPGRLFVPGLSAAPGQRLRLRIAAQDVMIARNRPEGLSALNILPAHVAALADDGAGGVMVQLRIGEQALLSRITARSHKALALAEGQPVYAVIKSVALA